MGRRQGAGTIARVAINVRSSFWFVPGLLTLASIALAVGLVGVGEETDRMLADRWPRMFAAEAEGSRAMLSAIASSMITVAGVVFSITILALAQASTQYTSRVLRMFMRDRLNQVVLGVFVGVFTYCLVVLRTISSDGRSEFVPSLAVFAGLVLAVVAIGFLILFIHHVATAIQAAEITRSVMFETQGAIDRLFPDSVGEDAEAPRAGADASWTWYPVPAAKSGYIQAVDADALLDFAVRHDAVLRMEAGIGEFVGEGRPIASLACALGPDDDAIDELNGLYAVDGFRTPEQDPAFGFRQLVDMALKALSPAVNDTTTAVTSLDYLSVLLQRVARRPAESPYRSQGGQLRVIARSPDFGDFAELAFGQILENAEGNTVVLLRLLRMAAEVAQVSQVPAHRHVLAARVDVIDEVAGRTARSTHARGLLAQAACTAREACSPGFAG